MDACLAILIFNVASKCFGLSMVIIGQGQPPWAMALGIFDGHRCALCKTGVHGAGCPLKTHKSPSSTHDCTRILEGVWASCATGHRDSNSIAAVDRCLLKNRFQKYVLPGFSKMAFIADDSKSGYGPFVSPETRRIQPIPSIAADLPAPMICFARPGTRPSAARDARHDDDR